MSPKMYCSIHHFSYSTTECPFCIKDRVDSAVKRMEKNKQPKVEENKEVTEESIFEELSKKFNVKQLKK